MFDKGIEAVLDFRSREEWQQWAEHYRYTVGPRVREYCLEWIKRNGIIDPYDGCKYRGGDVDINDNLREGLKVGGINSRGRAVFAAINDLCRLDPQFDRKDVKIFAPEAVTGFARRIRCRYTFFLGAEYLPSEDLRRRYYPIQHQDLCQLDLANDSFDLVVANDVFEHVPDLDQALAEIARVLAPHGRLVATFPFRLKSDETLHRARLLAGGKVKHLLPPEYHGNPVDPAGGALVYEVPGWDIIGRVLGAGFDDACMTFYCSMRYGILASGVNGVFVLNAKKRLAKSEAPWVRRWHVRNTAIRALACLIGLPRSGTTLLTALIDAHSRAHAVFEPWNATSRRKPAPEELGLDGFLREFEIKTGDRELLLVKETATIPSYLRSVDYLLDDATDRFDRYLIWLFRNPFHVYLSEIEARRKWWRMDDSVCSRESFDKWCLKSLRSMRTMLAMLRKHKGMVCCYESLISGPDDMVARVMEALGLTAEPNQLRYHETIDTGRVAGDLNIAQKPAPVSADSFQARERELSEIRGVIEHSADYTLINEINLWCDQIKTRGVLHYHDDAMDRLEEILS